VLQSRVHESWALRFASTLRTDTRYNTSDCFETFPFGEGWELSAGLEEAGKNYYEYREQLMAKSNQALTEIYNSFHDPNDKTPDIAMLRDLHSAMDRAVLETYGWSNIQPQCEFLPNDSDNEAGEDGQSRKQNSYRYRWSDKIRDGVLARLLELNHLRAEEEQLSGAAAEANSKSRANRQPRKGKKNMAVGTGSLLDNLSEEGQS
jgi:hypothetical protein